MLALHKELSCDISGWFDFAGLFILLMELLHPFLSGHHLKGRGRKREGGEAGSHEMMVDADQPEIETSSVPV